MAGGAARVAGSVEAQPVAVPRRRDRQRGSDAAMTVLDRHTGLGYCFWQCRNDRGTTPWGNVYSLADEGDGTPPVCTGSGLPSLGGLVRMSEIKGMYGGGAVPEGERIQLDPSIDVAAITGMTPGEPAVARALQVYGAAPYPGVGFTFDYFHMDRIPWDRLCVLRGWDGS